MTAYGPDHHYYYSQQTHQSQSLSNSPSPHPQQRQYVITKNSHFRSTNEVPSNMRLVDTTITNELIQAPPPGMRKSDTRIVKEVLPDGTEISRQIVVEEEETLVERRLYKYEPTSPIMTRRKDPASAIAVQTGIHQPGDLPLDDEHDEEHRLSNDSTSNQSNPAALALNNQRFNYQYSTHATNSSRTNLGGGGSSEDMTQKFPAYSGPTGGRMSGTSDGDQPYASAGDDQMRYESFPPPVGRGRGSKLDVPVSKTLSHTAGDLSVCSSSAYDYSPSIQTQPPFVCSVSVSHSKPNYQSHSLSYSLSNKPQFVTSSASPSPCDGVVESFNRISQAISKPRSRSQTSMHRQKLDIYSSNESSINKSPKSFTRKFKSSTRSKSNPVLSSLLSYSGIIYPPKLLRNDDIQPPNELSSTGFGPVARDAYHPYRGFDSQANFDGLKRAQTSLQAHKSKTQINIQESLESYDAAEYDSAALSLNFTKTKAEFDKLYNSLPRHYLRKEAESSASSTENLFSPSSTHEKFPIFSDDNLDDLVDAQSADSGVYLSARNAGRLSRKSQWEASDCDSASSELFSPRNVSSSRSLKAGDCGINEETVLVREEFSAYMSQPQPVAIGVDSNKNKPPVITRLSPTAFLQSHSTNISALSTKPNEPLPPPPPPRRPLNLPQREIPSSSSINCFSSSQFANLTQDAARTPPPLPPRSPNYEAFGAGAIGARTTSLSSMPMSNNYQLSSSNSVLYHQRNGFDQPGLPSEHEVLSMDYQKKLNLLKELADHEYYYRSIERAGNFPVHARAASNSHLAQQASQDSPRGRALNYSDSFKMAASNLDSPDPAAYQKFPYSAGYSPNGYGDASPGNNGGQNSNFVYETHDHYDYHNTYDNHGNYGPHSSGYTHHSKMDQTLENTQSFPYSGSGSSLDRSPGFPVARHDDSYDNTSRYYRQETEITRQTRQRYSESAEDDVVDRSISHDVFGARPPAPAHHDGSSNLPRNTRTSSQSAAVSKFGQFLMTKSCERCRVNFQEPSSRAITTTKNNNDGTQEVQYWHHACFACAHCLQPLHEDLYFDYEGRKYCEEDFNLLFAETCGECGQFAKGKVVRVAGRAYHEECFHCALCRKLLSVSDGNIRVHERKVYCKPCHMKIKSDKITCGECGKEIDEKSAGPDGGLCIGGYWYHAYHHRCCTCNYELTATARQHEGSLYCLKCFSNVTDTCPLCRKPIEKNELSILAMNKKWHKEHFRCAFCDKILDDTHYVYNAQPYCEKHYNQLFGDLCFYCNNTVQPHPGVSVEGKVKRYCKDHYECFYCSKPLADGSEPHLLDGRPICHKCTQRFPSDFRKQCFKSKAIDISVSAKLNATGKVFNPFKKSSAKAS